MPPSASGVGKRVLAPSRLRAGELCGTCASGRSDGSGFLRETTADGRLGERRPPSSNLPSIRSSSSGTHIEKIFFLGRYRTDDHGRFGQALDQVSFNPRHNPSKPSSTKPLPPSARQQTASCLALGPHEIGTIATISTGIAQGSGPPSIGFEELLAFPGEVFGITFNLDPDEIGVVLLGGGDPGGSDRTLGERRCLERCGSSNHRRYWARGACRVPAGT